VALAFLGSIVVCRAIRRHDLVLQFVRCLTKRKLARATRFDSRKKSDAHARLLEIIDNAALETWSNALALRSAITTSSACRTPSPGSFRARGHP